MEYLLPIYPINKTLNCYAFRRRIRSGLFLVLIIAIAFILTSPALAAWNNTPETIRTHPTWIYTPSRAMSNSKHVLFIVLHGCDQTNTQIRKFGNLTDTADNNAMVVAVPDVGANAFGPRCWDYNGARDDKGHMADLIGIAKDLMARPALQIDPKHVYIVGLSAGAAMALDVGCKAPDVFAGVGAIAGPSVGSDQQNNSVAESSAIPATNADDAARKCRSLAGPNAPDLDTQIANIAFGEMDLNGPNERFRFRSLLTDSDKRSHAGQIALVSMRWSDDNVKALQKLYGTDDLGPAEPIQGGMGTQRVARKNGKPRISLLTMHHIGHAWPAGNGEPNPIPASESLRPEVNLPTATRGIWLAQSGINYASHAASWLIGNNLRVEAITGMPVVNATASATSNKIDISGTATDSDGNITRIDTALLKETSGMFQQIDGHGPVPFNAMNGNYSDSFDNLKDARYKIQVAATDNANNMATAILEVTLGMPPPTPPCFTDSNFNHVQKGRAVQCSSGFTCAKGSGDILGLFNLFVESSVEDNPPGFFKKVERCASP